MKYLLHIHYVWRTYVCLHSKHSKGSQRWKKHHPYPQGVYNSKRNSFKKLFISYQLPKQNKKWGEKLGAASGIYNGRCLWRGWFLNPHVWILEELVQVTWARAPGALSLETGLVAPWSCPVSLSSWAFALVYPSPRWERLYLFLPSSLLCCTLCWWKQWCLWNIWSFLKTGFKSDLSWQCRSEIAGFPKWLFCFELVFKRAPPREKDGRGDRTAG